MANSAEPTIAAIAESCARIEAVCAGLDAAGWHHPTPLPVWDVQDVVAHLGSLEGLMLGLDEPPHELTALGHVRNPLGELNERLVDRRRAWPGERVLEEFRVNSARRLEELRSLDEQGLDREVPSPTGGVVPLRRFLGIRLWDYVVHELDICTALDLPLPLDTVGGGRVLDEMLALLPRGLAKAGAADGSTARIDITGGTGRSAAARLEGGRGVPVEPVPAGATTHLRAPAGTFMLVASGRRAPADAIAAGDIEVDGDGGLAAAILTAINVVP